MRYTVLIIFTFLSTIAKSDLILEYEVRIKKEHPLVDQSQLLPQKYFIYINENQIVTHYEGYNYVKEKYVFERNGNDVIRCYNQGDKKLKTNASRAEYNFKTQNDSTFQIQGYSCKKAEAKINNLKSVVYYADPYGIHFFEHGEIEGLPILFTKEHDIFEQVIYKLISLSVGKAPQDIFDTASYSMVEKSTPSDQPFFDHWVGEQAPKISFRTMKNRKAENYDWLGKVTVINFWFVNCPPCLSEIPLLNKLESLYGDNENVNFLAITYDSVDKLRQFENNWKFNYQLIPNASKVINQFDIMAYPSHILVGPDGKIMQQTVGNHPLIAYDLSKKIENLLNNLE